MDRIPVLKSCLRDELEEEEEEKLRQKIASSKLSKSRKRTAQTEEEKEEEAAFNRMGKAVKEMKNLSKQSPMDPLSESIAGVLSLYQGTFLSMD